MKILFLDLTAEMVWEAICKDFSAALSRAYAVNVVVKYDEDCSCLNYDSPFCIPPENPDLYMPHSCVVVDGDPKYPLECVIDDYQPFTVMSAEDWDNHLELIIDRYDEIVDLVTKIKSSK